MTRFLSVCLLLSLFVLSISGWEKLVNHEKMENEYKRSPDEEPRHVIQLPDDVDPEEFARDNNLILGPQVGELQSYYVFDGEFDEKQQQNEGESKTGERDARVQKHEKQEREFHYKRNLPYPSDPLYNFQWHIGLVSQDKIEEEVWSRGINGEGVTIAFIDDGLQHNHPDLWLNYNSSLSWDFNQGDSDPSPKYSSDAHGTCCAGVAAARDNSNCGVGVAPRAQIAGIRLISDGFYDYQAASALNYHMNEIDIYSNSWGPRDDSKHKQAPGWLAKTAIKNGVENGRNGKGSIYVWAAGNGRRNSDNTNYDGWASMRETIAVSAMNHEGQISWYSEEGASILVTAPSSGAGWGIVTTDLIGYMGSSRSECTYTFGGTSSSTPFVAGIIALWLQVNNDLTWRDIQSTIVHTSIKVDEDSDGWVTNGAGYHVNHNYGFGMINLLDGLYYVTDPEFQHVGDEREYYHEYSGINNVFTLENPLNYPVQIDEQIQIEHVLITLDIEHPSRGELEISLESPSGTISYLSRVHSDTNSDFKWTFMSVHYWGENSEGEWTLRIEDKRRGNDRGILKSMTLQILGE